MNNPGEEEFTITPPQKLSINLRELWVYRELFYFFTWRDVKVKYKQTALGVLWAVLQPIFMMLLFTFFFGRSLQIDTLGIPYPLFAFSGLVLWNVFSTGITNAGNSMVSNANIIKKIYFPRLIIPVSAILTSLIDFCFAMVVFLGLLVWFAQPVNFVMAGLFWPAGILMAAMGTLGPGCWLAALNVKYRDFRYVIPFLVQVLLFLTPVIYPVTIAKARWIQLLLALNPMYAAIEIFRAPMVGQLAAVDLIMVSVGSSVVFCILGLLYFKRTEMYFADLA